MKVHIALVGGQPAPVEKGILATAPDLVEFIYSQESKSAMEIISRRIPCPIVPSEPLDPTDPEMILARIDSLIEKYESDEITVNVSGGLKSWSHLFGIRFNELPNATVIYVDQNSILWNYRTMSGTPVAQADLANHLSLYGNDFQFISLSEYDRKDDLAADAIEQARNFATNEFNQLTFLFPSTKKKQWNEAVKNHYRDVFTLQSGSFLNWERRAANGMGNARIHLERKGGKIFDRYYESPHLVNLLFNSGWFEYKVAKILSEWGGAKKVYLNCVFKSESHRDKNEVDIIVETENRFIFVECKTKLATSTDIDKFNSVKASYGGTACLGIFVTINDLTDVEKEKCRQYGLIEPFAFHNDYKDDTRKKLYGLLNNALTRINAR